jgi:hypothetical protein
MPADILPSLYRPELIGDPLSTAPRVRRRFFAFLQHWRRWLRLQIGRSQAGNDDLADPGTDDLLALALLVQFVRDRAPDGLPSLDQLPRRQWPFTLGQLCSDLQSATSSAVVRAVFDPTGYANQCILPASVIECAFWSPIIQVSRRLYGPRLPVTIFGDLHQWCLAFSPGDAPTVKHAARSETRRYDKGIHYTPAALVNYLTSRVLAQACEGLSPDQVLERRILDPSCCCGVFLVAALRYLVAMLEARQARAPGGARPLSLQDRLEIAGRMIFGTDLDARAVQWTIRSVLLAAWDGRAPIVDTTDGRPVVVPDLSRNIVARDFLASATLGSADQRVDVILGGPPFVRLQQMLHAHPAAVAGYKRQFRTARSGQFDLYMLFLEKAIGLLAHKGWLAFSVSNTFLRSDSGLVLCCLIGEQCQVHDIIEFEDAKIYPDALIQITLIVLQQGSARTDGRHVWIRGKGQLQKKLAALASASVHETVETRPLPADMVRSDRWVFQSVTETDMLARIEAVGTPLSHLPVYLGHGLVTGADDVFLLRNLQQQKDGSILVEQRKTGRQVWIESALLRPIIRNRDIRGYSQPTPSTNCLVPYSRSGHLFAGELLRQDYPRAYEYLLSCRDQLTVSACRQRREWYAFPSVRAFRFATRTKVIGGLITSGGDMTIHENPDVLCHSGVLVMVPNYLLIDPYYLLGICNSSVFWTFVEHRMPTMGPGRRSLRLERLRAFPLVVADTENQSVVQEIAGGARRLVAGPLTASERATIKASIDHMVRELYGLG